MIGSGGRRRSMPYDPPTLRQKVLQLVVDRIVVEAALIIIHHVVPMGPV